MLLSIIIIIVILFLMIFTLYFILKGILNNVKEKGKEYFALRLSELDKNNKRDTEVKEEEKDNETQEIKSEDTSNNQGSVVLYQSKNVNNYDVKEVLEFVKKIDTKFNFDDRYIVEEFVKQTESDNSSLRYDKLIDVKKLIEKVGVYKLLTSDEDTINKIKVEISKIDSDIIETYEKINEEFDIENFIAYLDIEIKKSDPSIYIFVGNKSISYDDISNRIKTIYRDEVYKGIKILYKGNIYDYSLG